MSDSPNTGFDFLNAVEVGFKQVVAAHSTGWAAIKVFGGQVVVLLFGPPGSGKGTQAARITGSLGVPAISTGNMLRAEIDADTSLGRKAAAILKRGGLVDDGLVNEMLAARLQRPDCRDGFLLDGYPRTVAQSRFLDRLLHEQGFPQPVVIHLDVPFHVLVQRLSARRQCGSCGRIYSSGTKCEQCGGTLQQRADDRPEVISERLRTYAEQTDPVVEFYLYGDYHMVNADRPPDEVYKEIEGVLENVLVRVARAR